MCRVQRRAERRAGFFSRWLLMPCSEMYRMVCLHQLACALWRTCSCGAAALPAAQQLTFECMCIVTWRAQGSACWCWRQGAGCCVLEQPSRDRVALGLKDLSHWPHSTPAWIYSFLIICGYQRVAGVGDEESYVGREVHSHGAGGYALTLPEQQVRSMLTPSAVYRLHGVRQAMPTRSSCSNGTDSKVEGSALESRVRCSLHQLVECCVAHAVLLLPAQHHVENIRQAALLPHAGPCGPRHRRAPAKREAPSLIRGARICQPFPPGRLTARLAAQQAEAQRAAGQQAASGRQQRRSRSAPVCGRGRRLLAALRENARYTNCDICGPVAPTDYPSRLAKPARRPPPRHQAKSRGFPSQRLFSGRTRQSGAIPVSPDNRFH